MRASHGRAAREGMALRRAGAGQSTRFRLIRSSPTGEVRPHPLRCDVPPRLCRTPSNAFTGTDNADKGTDNGVTGTDNADKGTSNAFTGTDNADKGTSYAFTGTDNADKGTSDALRS